MTGLPLAVGIAVFLAGEPRHAPLVGGGIDALWRRLRLNPALRSVLGVDLAIGLATSITASLYLFLVEKTFALAHSSTLLLCYFVAGLAGMPIWTRLSYRSDKHGTLAGRPLDDGRGRAVALPARRAGTPSAARRSLSLLALLQPRISGKAVADRFDPPLWVWRSGVGHA